MQRRPPISFLLLFGTNLSPQKVWHFLISRNSIRIAPKMTCLRCPNGIRGACYAGAVAPKWATFLRGGVLLHPSLSKMKFPPHRQNRTLSTQWTFFSNSPDRFALFLGLWRACLAHLTTCNTFVGLCVCPQMGFSPLGSHISRILCTFQQKQFFF